MGLRSYLYHRLAPLVTCTFRLGTGGKLALGSELEVLSFADVVLHPFYWRAYDLLDSPPRVIADCGAHCGHFTVLADLCARAKFGKPAEQYILCEPNPHLLPVIRRNLEAVGIATRATVLRGLLGTTEPSVLWVDPKNPLASSLQPAAGTRPHQLPAVRLSDAVPDGTIDLLKVDIEGGEYGMVRHEPELFARASILLMECHAMPGEDQSALLSTLADRGLREVSPRMEHCGHTLITMARR
jgi:FkbM family methyltransferase